MAYIPKSALAARLLELPSFGPRCGVPSDKLPFTTAGPLADRLDLDPNDVEACFAEFAAQGLLEPARVMRPAGEPHPPTYRVKPEAWRVREDLLRERGLRHHALTRQLDFSPRDLVLALLIQPQLENERILRGLGRETNVARAQLAFYMDAFSLDVVDDAVENLIRDGLVSRPHRDDDLRGTEKGRRAYGRDVAYRLGLHPDEGILDLVLDKTVRLFFSWQSEYKVSRRLIGDLLKVVVERVNMKGPVRPLEIIQATDVGDGAVRIDVQLMDLIKKADLVVADVTAVAHDNGRRRLNDNVLIEVGYALASKVPSEVVLLCVKRDDLPAGNVAFDISNVHRIELDQGDKKGGRVQAEIEAILTRKGWLPKS